MSINCTVVDVVHLPRNFHRLGNASMHALLKDSGYFSIHGQVTEHAILEALKAHPECVHDWMAWSEDKRSSTGWFFRRNGESAFEIAYFREYGDPSDVNEYSDATTACAAFIKREVETIRTDGTYTGVGDLPV